MSGILEAFRERLGSPPRALSSEDARAMRLIWPVIIPPFDPLFRVYIYQRALRERGQVVWGHLVQANEALWHPGLMPMPATVVYGEPDLDDVGLLAEVADLLMRLKGTRRKEPELRAAVDLTHETSRKLRRPIPASLTAGVPIYCSDLMIHRRHLPGGTFRKIKKPVLPLLINPEETSTTMVLPHSFWPPKFLEYWES